MGAAVERISFCQCCLRYGASAEKTCGQMGQRRAQRGEESSMQVGKGRGPVLSSKDSLRASCSALVPGSEG